MLAVAVYKSVRTAFLGFLSFHHESQLINLTEFYLPGNCAFWSVGLFFALRTVSQITYQQLIHISCGLIPIMSPERKFHGRIIPSNFLSLIKSTRLHLRSWKVHRRAATAARRA